MSTQISPDAQSGFPIKFQATARDKSIHEYVAAYIPASDAVLLSLRLVKALGEPLAALAGALFAEDEVEDDPDVGKALTDLGPALKGMDPVELDDVARKIAGYAFRDGKALRGVGFDQAFNGNLREFYEVVFRLITGNNLIPLPGT